MAKKQKKYVYRYWDGEAYKQRTFDTLREKEHFRLTWKTQPVEEPKPEVAEPEIRTFRELSDKWFSVHCQVNKGEKQQDEDLRRLRHYLLPHLGDLELAMLKPSHLYDLKAHLVKHGGVKKKVLRPKSINLVLDQAKAILTYAVKNEWLPRNPFEKVEGLEVGDQAVGFWTPEQLRLFLNHCRRINPRFADLVQFAGLTGLRRGELIALKRGDIDFEQKTVTVRDAYCTVKKGDKGKTKEANVVTIPVPAEALDAIKHRRLIRHTEPVFYRPMVQHAVRTLQSIAEKAGVPEIRFHDIRHTYGTQVAKQSGGDITRMMRMLRHKTPEMSIRYTHILVEDLREISEALGADIRPSIRPAEVKSASG